MFDVFVLVVWSLAFVLPILRVCACVVCMIFFVAMFFLLKLTFVGIFRVSAILDIVVAVSKYTTTIFSPRKLYVDTKTTRQRWHGQGYRRS